MKLLLLLADKVTGLAHVLVADRIGQIHRRSATRGSSRRD